MSEAPERICVYPLEGTWAYGGMEFAESDEPEQVEYVRADRIEEMEANLAKALECLKFYAENKFPDDYPGGVMYIPENSNDADYLEYCLDYGDKARAILAELRDF